ncbi:MAG: hypothetical protein F2788_02120 [Actinobacteria bacterium]|nr:hypothetical protein [Actinomycetota bacterium]
MIMRPFQSAVSTTVLVLAFGVISGFSSSAPTSAGSRHPTLGEYVSSQSGSVTMGWQRSSGVSKAAWPTAVADETVKIDSRGRAFVVDPPLPAQKISGTTRAAPVVTDIPLTDAFVLHSRPDSTKVIYLDFDGQTMTNTAWSRYVPLVVPAYSIDGSPSFSSTEKQNVIDAWSAVAEDYSMFDVDVTTEDPGQSDIDRTSYGDVRYGVRALITDENNGIADIACPTGCQGVAYIGTFDYVDPEGDWEWYSPAFVFSRDIFSGKKLSDVISHEVGHNLGLSHDGQASDPYYEGRSGWAPIMGAGYYQPLVQWSNGDYSKKATNREDDFAVMQSHGLSLMADDFGNSSSTATTVLLNTSTSGTIHSRSDVDYFRFVATATSVDIAVILPSYSPDLDCSLTVLDSLNRTVATDNPNFLSLGTNSATGLTASATVTVTPGQTYFVKVDGSGFGKASSTGYSDYGSVGEYRLEVSGDTRPTLTPGTPTVTGIAQFGETLTGNVGSWGAEVSTSTEWFVGQTATGDTDNTYVVQSADVGKIVSFRVTASKAGYQDSVVSATTQPAVAAEMDLTDTPSISGILKVGNTLTVDIGSWESGAATSQQWRRNGSPISSATGTTYVLQRSDGGKRISVTVTATKAGYTTVTATSALTGKVAK